MDGRNTVASLGVGIGIALLFSVMNGLSTYLFKGETIMEKSVGLVGGSQ